MRHRFPCGRDRTALDRAMLSAMALGMLCLAGCAPLDQLKARLGFQPQARPVVVVTPPRTPQPQSSATEGTPEVPLATILTHDLQRGRYAEGEEALRGYLARHPRDRTAQLMLRQLTSDPVRMLGSDSRPYVVQSGDSYGSLASRHLGDARLFLILARYNGSTNPSLLRLGQKLRLPTSAATALRKTAGEQHSAELAGNASATPPAVASHLPGAGIGSGAPATGKPDPARSRPPKAGAGQPGPGPGTRSAAGACRCRAAALRKQVVASYHQRAIVLYRDQQLDQAIALWDRVLAINPDYEASHRLPHPCARTQAAAQSTLGVLATLNRTMATDRLHVRARRSGGWAGSPRRPACCQRASGIGGDGHAAPRSSD